MIVPTLSAAGSALGADNIYGGLSLSQQVKDETEEQKRKRLQQSQTQVQVAGFSPAASALLGTTV